MPASHNWSMGQSQTNASPANSGNASQSGEVLMWTIYLGRPFASLAFVARRPRGSPLGSGKAMVEAASSHVNCFGRQAVVLDHDIRRKLSDW